MNYEIPKNSYVFAHLWDWGGNEEYLKIEPKRVDDIVSAIQGQFYYQDTKGKFSFDGRLYRKVDVIAVDKKEFDNAKKEIHHK